MVSLHCFLLQQCRNSGKCQPLVYLESRTGRYIIPICILKKILKLFFLSQIKSGMQLILCYYKVNL